METCYWGISNICGLDYYTLSCRQNIETEETRYEDRKNIEKLRSKGYSVSVEGMDQTLALAGF